HREVAETVVLLLAGVVCPSLGFPRSRVRFPAGVVEALATTSAWNKSFRAQPRPDGVLLRHNRRARGGGAPCEERLYRSPTSVHLRLRQAAKVRGFCSKAAEQAGAADDWRLDLIRSSLDGNGRRRRVEVQELRSLGCDPSRCAIADGSILFFGTGVYCDSLQSRQAMEFLQLKDVLGVLSNGGSRRRRSRASLVSQGPRDLVVICLFFRVLYVVWVGQLSLYPSSMFLYLYPYLYVFLI
ncbi:unnamed protein product, partial [Urochloa humidicola]